MISIFDFIEKNPLAKLRALEASVAEKDKEERGEKREKTRRRDGPGGWGER